ncbi:DUF2231 domain-containing protein [Corynebacterium vitaeruminis]|uniref:DUF2231 domain-containing protein n=1 Tax=Corynebacterium vitaeruminis DSM 20294 TaxID=1224164 RepID=W5XYZ3_9CORY|nr:DUF2231 domain-containing protein [Corynebacterium vitaeruminis]AHI22187.1 hypothetical protein B843_03990 [Corynebacterium vitaeruminis DSM 20294]
MLENIGGIPAHPLFVHLAVVAVPVAALVFLVSLVRPDTKAWRVTNGCFAVLAVASTILARSTGEGLLKAMGFSEEDPGKLADHAQFANYMTASVFAFAALVVVLVVLLWLGKSKTAATILKVLAAIAAIAVIVTTVMTGHEGAVQTWTH